MNILITGASGFVGYHLAKRLTDEGHFVRCLIRNKNKIQLLKGLNVQLFEGDLLDPKSLKDIAQGIDVIYHLAGVVYSRNINDFTIGNVLSTNNLLEEIKCLNIKCFIYVSSLSVYSPPKEKKLLNEQSLCKPITFYGKSKLKAEEVVFDCYNKYQLPIVIVRAPIIYGAYQPKVLTKYFNQIIRHRKTLLVGDGEYLRSFCYIDNFVNSIILLGNSRKGVGNVYNISDKEVYTFNKMIKLISKIIKAPVKIIRLPKIFGDVIWCVSKFLERIFGIYLIEAYALKTMTINLGCDSSKFENDFGRFSMIDFEEGLSRTFEWINQEDRCGYK